MELTIKSNRDGFVLLDRICGMNENGIEGGVFLPDNAPYFWPVEAMAQLGGMHVRSAHDFDRHVFLLKIEDLEFFMETAERGDYLLRAMLRAKSDRAFSYRIRMESERKSSFAEGTFWFASLPYDRVFKEEKLKNNYKELFECLRKNSKDAC